MEAFLISPKKLKLTKHDEKVQEFKQCTSIVKTTN